MRHESIISTGYDPASGTYRGSVDVVFGNGKTLNIPNIPDSQMSYIAEHLMSLGDMLTRAAEMARSVGADLNKTPLMVQISSKMWGVDVSYIKETNSWYLSMGPTTGAGVSFGPLVLGNLDKADSILPGCSWSSTLQITPLIGGQAVWNKYGSLGGPTVGFVGVSTGYSCGQKVQF